MAKAKSQTLTSARYSRTRASTALLDKLFVNEGHAFGYFGSVNAKKYQNPTHEFIFHLTNGNTSQRSADRGAASRTALNAGGILAWRTRRASHL